MKNKENLELVIVLVLTILIFYTTAAIMNYSINLTQWNIITTGESLIISTVIIFMLYKSLP